MVILLRRVLLRGPRVENTVVAASVFFETFTTLAVGAAVSRGGAARFGIPTRCC